MGLDNMTSSSSISGLARRFATTALRSAVVKISVIDRSRSHLLKPLLDQVATGLLSEGEIAPSRREVLQHERNAKVLLNEVSPIDLSASMAAASPFRAAAAIGPLRLSGAPAWLVGLVVHLRFLTGSKVRFSRLFDWTFTFVGQSCTERALVGVPVFFSATRGTKEGPR